MSCYPTVDGFGAGGVGVASKAESGSPTESDDESDRGSGFGLRFVARCVGIGAAFLLIAASSGFGADAAQAGRNQDPQITILVYNYSEARPSTLQRAIDEAQRILARAGINTSWIICPMSKAQGKKNPVCRHALRPAELVLRIHAKYQAAHPSFQQATLGFVPRAKGEEPSYVSVFYDRVMILADNREFSPGMILGHAVAHEIGHVLLGPESHAADGIMCAYWDRGLLHKAACGQLLFTSIQAEMIRARARARDTLSTNRAGADSPEYRQKAVETLRSDTPGSLRKEAGNVTHVGQ